VITFFLLAIFAPPSFGSDSHLDQTARHPSDRRGRTIEGLPPQSHTVDGIPDSDFPSVRRLNGCRLNLPDPFDPRARTVLLVHGFNSTSAFFAKFAGRCREDGIQVVSYDYPSGLSASTAAQQLGGELRSLEAKQKGVHLVVVAHSIGGLIARAALELQPNESRPTCITDVFFLGTPHRGTRLADPKTPLEARIAQTLVAVTASLGGRCSRESTAIPADIAPNSAFLERLARQKPPQNVRYHSLIGTKGLVDARSKAKLRDEWRRQIKRLRLAPTEEAATRDLVDRLTELHEGLGDGVVSVESARLLQAKSERMVHLDHFELLSQPDEAFRFMIQQMGWQTGKNGP